MTLKGLTGLAILSFQFLLPNAGIAEGDAVWNTKGAVWTSPQRSDHIEVDPNHTCDGDEQTGIGTLEPVTAGSNFYFQTADVNFRITVKGYNKIEFSTDRKLRSTDGEVLNARTIVMAKPDISGSTGAFADHFHWDSLLPTNEFQGSSDETIAISEDISMLNGEEGSTNVKLDFRISPLLSDGQQMSELLKKDWRFEVVFSCMNT